MRIRETKEKVTNKQRREYKQIIRIIDQAYERTVKSVKRGSGGVSGSSVCQDDFRLMF